MKRVRQRFAAAVLSRDDNGPLRAAAVFVTETLWAEKYDKKAPTPAEHGPERATESMLPQYLGESSIFDECGDAREIGVHDSRQLAENPVAVERLFLGNFNSVVHVAICDKRMRASTAGIKTPKRGAIDGVARGHNFCSIQYRNSCIPLAFHLVRKCPYSRENQLRVQRRSLAPALSGHSQ